MMTKRVATSDLTGSALDWAVARSLKMNTVVVNGEFTVMECTVRGIPVQKKASFSGDWALLGPLITVYNISTNFIQQGVIVAVCCDDHGNTKTLPGSDKEAYGVGDTHTEAACRAIVTCELGEYVDVPEVLL